MKVAQCKLEKNYSKVKQRHSTAGEIRLVIGTKQKHYMRVRGSSRTADTKLTWVRQLLRSFLYQTRFLFLEVCAMGACWQTRGY